MEEQTGDTAASASETFGESTISALVAKVQQRAPRDAVLLLEQQSDSLIAAVLSQTVAASAIAILAEFSVERAAAIQLEAPPEKRGAMATQRGLSGGQRGEAHGAGACDLSDRKKASRPQ